MSTIKCRTCYSPMVLDRCETSGHSTTCWHQCPVCKQKRLTSEYESSTSQRAISSHGDDDGGIASDYEVAYGSSYTL